MAFLSLLPSSFFWVVVLSLSLFVRGAVWVVLRLFFFRLGGVASSLLPFGWYCVLSLCWLVVFSLSTLGWRSLPFSSTIGCGRSTTSKKEEGPPLSTPTIEPEATQGGHIGRASPCEDRPLNGVCVRSKFSCGIVGAVSVHGVSGNNADFQGGSCAGGFVRVRWRCLVVAGSQTL